jgi:hypothetical protein
MELLMAEKFSLTVVLEVLVEILTLEAHQELVVGEEQGGLEMVQATPSVVVAEEMLLLILVVALLVVLVKTEPVKVALEAAVVELTTTVTVVELEATLVEDLVVMAEAAEAALAEVFA